MLHIDGERKSQGRLRLRVARGAKMHRLIHTYGNPKSAVGLGRLVSLTNELAFPAVMDID